jgi:ubiquinone/menaquinone biosynthesis C-methylase UbiE
MRKIELYEKEFVNEQYKQTDNINCRISLHDKYSSNKYGLHKWLFDQIEILHYKNVLEIGCGVGTLWKNNLKKVPNGIQVLLSDSSPAMVKSCKEALHNNSQFAYSIIDAQNLPLLSQTYDVIIANHMLYHVQNKGAVLSEIKRVLKTNGRLFASTVGKDNLKELNEIVIGYNPDLVWWSLTNSFQLDEAPILLKNYFTTVEVRKYPDMLVVTNHKDLVEYILSGKGRAFNINRELFSNYIEKEFMKHGGKLSITKDAGIIIAS